MRVTTIICIMLIFLGCNFASEKRQVSSNKTSSAKALAITDSLEKEILPYKTFKEFNGDTLSYITYNFVDRKKVYENKPLDAFLKDLELPILTFNKSFGYPPNDKYLQDITFKLECDVDIHNKFKLKVVPNLIIVKLESSFTFDDVQPVIVKSQLKWTPEASSFFGKEIIKEIKLVTYQK